MSWMHTMLMEVYAKICPELESGEIRFPEGYAEPGYTAEECEGAPLIAIGDWNRSKRLAKTLERMGFELEWSDEWSECSGCYKVFRTQGDCYTWKPSYAWVYGEPYCHECLMEDPAAYLEGLQDNPDTCCVLDISPEDHGYKKVGAEEYESGWYGREADPHEIFKALSKEGHRGIVFVLERNEQFRSTFTAWALDDESGEQEQEKSAA